MQLIASTLSMSVIYNDTISIILQLHSGVYFLTKSGWCQEPSDKKCSNSRIFYANLWNCTMICTSNMITLL